MRKPPLGATSPKYHPSIPAPSHAPYPIMTYHYQLTCITETATVESLLCDLAEASELSGLHPEMIEELLRGQLVQAFQSPKGEVFFDQAGIARLRQIAYLREHENTSLRTLRYIVGLLDNLEAKDKELRELRERVP